MAQFYDAEGNAVEGLSKEEADKLSEEAERSKEEFEKLKAELQTKEEQLAKLKEKDLNFSNLRQQKDDVEKKVDALKQEIDEKVSLAKKEVFEGVMKDHYAGTLSALAGDDEELKKKIEFHYNRLNDPVTSKPEMEKKLRDAWSLAQEAPKSTSGLAFATMGSAPLKPQSSGNKYTEEEKAFAKKMAASGGINLTDEDFKKF